MIPTPKIYSPEFDSAVAAIQTRAERHDYEVTRILQQIFVDNGLLVQIHTNKNQIIMGRRGSGKTHLLLALQNSIRSSKGLFIYIDLRRLGSGLSDTETNYDSVARRMFLALLNRISELCLDEVLRLESPTSAKRQAAEEAWNQLTAPIANVELKPANFCAALENFLHAMGFSHCTLVLDEWVETPRLVQPLLAELLRHAFIHSRVISIKIAAIDFQSLFSTTINGQRVGFELGADVFADLEMDSLLIYDKESKSVVNFFGKMLFNHLEPNLKDIKLSDDQKYDWIIQTCFTQEKAFVELVRASEGVPRDFLHIFVLAYFRGRSSKDHAGAKIDVLLIRKASQEWYTRDKYINIRDDSRLADLLHSIITDVIGKHRARTFMVPQELSRHPLLLKLFDARVIHILKRGWSHQDKPGQRYDIFSIDYGTYVDLINTEKEPQMELIKVGEDVKPADQLVVPFDDFRSIRRIELTQEILDRHSRADRRN